MAIISRLLRLKGKAASRSKSVTCFKVRWPFFVQAAEVSLRLTCGRMSPSVRVLVVRVVVLKFKTASSK